MKFKILSMLLILFSVINSAYLPEKKGVSFDLVIYDCLQQKSDTCGYHTVKNAIMVLQWLNSPIKKSEANLIKSLKNPALFDFEKMSNLVRKNKQDKNFLFEDEIESLMDNKAKQFAEQYVLIPDIINTAKDNRLCSKKASDLIKKLRQQKNCCYAFIIGDKLHWITVVVERDGNKYKLYLVNSLDTYAHTIAMVNALKQLITTLRFDIAKSAEYQMLMDDAISEFNKKRNIESVINNIERVINSKSFTVNSFAKQYLKQAENILETIYLTYPEYKLKANNLLSVLKIQTME